MELRCYVEFYVGKIPRICTGGARLERAVVLKWFYSLSRRKTFVRGKCALPSALLVMFGFVFVSTSAVDCIYRLISITTVMY